MSGKPIDEAVLTTVRFLDGGVVQMDRADYDRLTAAQQQGQAVAWTDEQVGAAIGAHYRALKAGKLPSEAWRIALTAAVNTAPPPSVPEGVEALANHFDSVRNDLPDEWQDFAAEFSRDLRALAQQPAAGAVDRDAVAKQTGALRELAAIIRKHGICPSLAIETVADRIDAALATQHQEPKS